MKVIATKKGFYAGQLVDEGDEFTLDSDKHFSENWMKKVDGRKRKKVEKVETEEEQEGV